MVTSIVVTLGAARGAALLDAWSSGRAVEIVPVQNLRGTEWSVLRLAHLNITVADLGRSSEFYRRWFGFDRVLAEYNDETRFITDGSGFELGLHREDRPAPSNDWHFGFLASNPDAVRELRSAMAAAEVAVLELEDSDGYVGFKCHDPDGHTIEIYFEPR